MIILFILDKQGSLTLKVSRVKRRIIEEENFNDERERVEENDNSKDKEDEDKSLDDEEDDEDEGL